MPDPPGRLYLIPVPLGGADAVSVVPPATLAVVRRLREFVVENEKPARRFLKAAGYPLPLREARLRRLDEHTREEALGDLLAPMLAGKDCGLMSEAGCPAIADPGAALVRRAHEKRIEVVPLVGPCSIVLALMASGMDGQRFAFHGYLPVDRARRTAALKALDARAGQATQVFIETPYRNAAMLQAVLEHCRPDTRLCVAADLTLDTALVANRSVAEWRAAPPQLDRRPAVLPVVSRPERSRRGAGKCLAACRT